MIKHLKTKRSDFQTVVDDKATDLCFLKNQNGLEMSVTNFGARIIELWVPDKNGHFADIVLGHNHINKYINYKGERFLGSTIGRFGNRIAKGQFYLNGRKYQVPVNEGQNSLHGGWKGFDMVVWDVEQVTQNEISFRYLSKDGEEGYPGNLDIRLSYELTDDNDLVITHSATTDKTTIINLTHHSFFNLHGEGDGTINDHYLKINARQFTAINSRLIPTGILQDVDATPMDFRNATEIGSRLDLDFRQLKYGKGYDHNWVIDRKTQNYLELAATIHEPKSGRNMEVHTTEPGIQFYGGNFFDGKIIGKSGKAYSHRACFALETQHFPDSPNHPEFPSTVLNPGQNYRHICVYKFSVNR